MKTQNCFTFDDVVNKYRNAHKTGNYSPVLSYLLKKSGKLLDLILHKEICVAGNNRDNLTDIYYQGHFIMTYENFEPLNDKAVS